MQRTAREGMNKFLGDKVELRGVSKNGRFLRPPLIYDKDKESLIQYRHAS